MASVAASELGRNFGEWHDKAFQGPVEITCSGRTTAVLVSVEMYRDLMASYRKAVPVADLDDDTMALIRRADVTTDRPYSLDDLPDADVRPAASG